MALGKFIRVFYGQTQPWLQSSFVISVIVSTRGIAKDCLPAPAVKSSRNLEGTPSRHPISNRRCNPASGFEKPSTGNKQTKNCSNKDGGEGGILPREQQENPINSLKPNPRRIKAYLRPVPF
jgi:hypothetical protein